MPLYYFDVLERDGSIIRDRVGIELDNAEQALEAASRALMDVLQDHGMRHPEFEVQVIVRDAQGRILGRRRAALNKSDQPD